MRTVPTPQSAVAAVEPPGEDGSYAAIPSFSLSINALFEALRAG